MENDRYDVFISYRRDGGELYSCFLFEKLSHLGYLVFRDQQSLGPGFFDEKLLAAIRECRDFVLVMTGESLDRCLEDGDWVRREIATALQCRANVIPLQIGKFAWPQSLPEDIANLSRCNGLETDEHNFAERVEFRLPGLLRSRPQPVQEAVCALAPRAARPKNIFFGRDHILEDIRRRLTESSNILFISGMGGMGKSELAKAYAQRYQHEYSTVVFARFQDSILNTFIDDEAFDLSGIRRQLSETVKMEPREKYFSRKLAALKKCAHSDTLIIIDNFDISPEQLDDYFFDFASGDYHLLFTSRSDLSEYYETVQLSTVNDLETARQIFYAYYGKKQPDTPDADVDRLLSCVQLHTMTIELIAKQMKLTHSEPKSLLEALRSRGVQALDSRVSAPVAGARPEPAYEYISVLFDTERLEEQEKRTLRFLSLMPPDGAETRDFLAWTKSSDFDVISQLAAKSWIELDADSDKLSLHPIVSDIVRLKLHPDKASCGELLETAGELWSKVKPLLEGAGWQQALEPLLLIYRWLRQLLARDDAWLLEVCGSIALCYDSLTCYSEAIPYYEALLSDVARGEKKAAPEQMSALRRYAYCMNNGSCEGSRVYAVRKNTLERARELFPDGSVQLLPYYEDLANSLVDMEQYDESLELRSMILDSYEKDASTPPETLLYAKSALSNIYIFLEQAQQAAELRAEVYRKAEECLGRRHPAFSVAGSNLACAYLLMGRGGEALTLLEEAYYSLRDIRGEGDFYTLCLATNLGAASGCAGDASAIMRCEYAHAKQLNIWGADNDVTLKSQANLASSYFAAGDIEQANRLEEEILSLANAVREFPQPLLRQLRANHEVTRAALSGVASDALPPRRWLTVPLMLPGLAH